jgi:hypothetical protein
LRHAGGEAERLLELGEDMYDETPLRYIECCEGRSGTVGENSCASKSSMLTARLACESYAESYAVDAA